MSPRLKRLVVIVFLSLSVASITPASAAATEEPERAVALPGIEANTGIPVDQVHSEGPVPAGCMHEVSLNDLSDHLVELMCLTLRKLGVDVCGLVESTR